MVTTAARGTWRVFTAVLSALFSIGCTSVGRSDLTEDGHRYNFVEAGGGTPVVFEAGLGDTSRTWSEVWPAVGQFAHAFAYNRAGYAGSTARPAPRTASTIVDELRALLQSRGLRPPYVLVGHSIGGLYMQYYARNHPNEVAALILVDSTHWNHQARLRAAAPGVLATVRTLQHVMPEPARSELAAAAATEREVRDSPPLAMMLLVVISATERSILERSAAAEMAAMQRELADQLPSGVHVLAHGSTHYVQRDDPATVIRAIRSVVEQLATEDAASAIKKPAVPH